jgi:hypothetical protein
VSFATAPSPTLASADDASGAPASGVEPTWVELPPQDDARAARQQSESKLDRKVNLPRDGVAKGRDAFVDAHGHRATVGGATVFWSCSPIEAALLACREMQMDMLSTRCAQMDRSQPAKLERLATISSDRPLGNPHPPPSAPASPTRVTVAREGARPARPPSTRRGRACRELSWRQSRGRSRRAGRGLPARRTWRR